MKKILFAITFLALATTFIVFKTRGNKESESQPQLNKNSLSTASVSVLPSGGAQSNVQSESSGEDLERIKTAIDLRETAPTAYGKSRNGKNSVGSNDVESNRYTQSNPKESQPLTTETGIEIKPNKYTRPVLNADGNKRLELLPYIPDLPHLNSGTDYMHCPNDINLNFEDFKRGAETGNACMYFQYATRGMAKFLMDGSDMTQDRDAWKLKLKPYIEYLIKATINGDSWAAREIGCTYLYPPFEDKTEGLAWYMISSAMGSSKLLGSEHCSATLLSEPEQTYTEAIERAKFYIDYYNFKVQ